MERDSPYWILLIPDCLGGIFVIAIVNQRTNYILRNASIGLKRAAFLAG